MPGGSWGTEASPPSILGEGVTAGSGSWLSSVAAFSFWPIQNSCNSEGELADFPAQSPVIPLPPLRLSSEPFVKVSLVSWAPGLVPEGNGAGVLNWISKTKMINDQLQLILTGRTKERKQEVPERQVTSARCSGVSLGVLTVKPGGRRDSVDSCVGMLASTSLLSTQRWCTHT